MLRHTLTRVFLLNKRFLKQPMFIVLLLMVPLLVFGVHIISEDSYSLVTVAVAPQDPDDSLAASVTEQLVSDPGSAVRYYYCADEEALKNEISSGRARLGFLFPSPLGDLFDAYGSQDTAGSSDNAVSALSALFSKADETLSDDPIVCYVATNDIVSKLTREQLYGKIFRQLEAAVLKDYIMSTPLAGACSEEQLDSYAESILDESMSDHNFFELAYLNGDTLSDDEIGNYMVSPVRGLLASLLTLTALAAVLYLCDDLRRQRFVWVSPAKMPLFCYGYLVIPLADVGLAVYPALILSGTFTSWQTELPALLLFLLCAASFADLLRVILRRVTLIASSVPIILCACLFLTPVFMDLTVAEPLQVLLPPYLYLKSVHGIYPVWSMGIYAAAAFVLALLLGRRDA